jgi:hypothetical protein
MEVIIVGEGDWNPKQDFLNSLLGVVRHDENEDAGFFTPKHATVVDNTAFLASLGFGLSSALGASESLTLLATPGPNCIRVLTPL